MNYNITQASVLDWAGLHPFGTLKVSIGPTMARLTERNQIAQFISFFVAVHTKQSEWKNMMNALSCLQTALARVVITLQCLAALRSPIRAAIVVAAIDIHRVIQAMPVRITAHTRAIFSSTFPRLENAFIDPKWLTTVKAFKVSHTSSWWTRSHSSMLAGRRTVSPTPMFYPRWYLLKFFLAVFTR